MESVQTLIAGAGVTGLATAAWLGEREYLVLEADREVGGYCKTIRRDGFVWDYSGHFFHFRRPEIERWLRERMANQRVRTIQKRSFISYAGRMIDFPFQKNIHQLPKEELIDCLYDLYFARAPAELLGEERPAAPERNFKEMLYARYGRSIAEKFLIPYNEKLYACDVSILDLDAMGRFFPHAELTEVIRGMKQAPDAGYNATFTYPEGGAIEYVNALVSATRPGAISLDEPLVGLDLARKVARTPKRELRYQHLVSSVPLNRLAKLAGLPHDESAFSWNKVLVFNLGFDRKGRRDVHWIYYPDRRRSFYRVGFYDNILEGDRSSLYVELGLRSDEQVELQAAKARVIEDLRAEGVIDEHRLVAEHSVVMDPAYVHITSRSVSERDRLRAVLKEHGVYSIGRYGGWTYCSIEDNIVEAKQVAAEIG